VDDFVLARSEFDPNGPLELKRVEEKFARTAVVMELVVHGQSIKTTAEHPFFVPVQGKFVAAGELKVAEQLVGHDGKLVQCRPGVRCATPGFVVGLLRSHPDHFHQPQRGFNIKAQGRAAHPGITAPDTREPQRGSTSQPLDALIGSRL
jgi:hypothetical protein